MKIYIILILILLGNTCKAQELLNCNSNSTCVANEDLKTFIQLAQDKKCQQEQLPIFSLDSIKIITDQEGRVFYTGSTPYPYTLSMKWCNYEVEAKGLISVVVAKSLPPTWGFRFRPKFIGGILIVDSIEEKSLETGLDLGLSWDFLYWKDLNFSIDTSFRSVGADIGLDLTRNFGVFTGYAFSWFTLKHNPKVGLFFSFF